MVTTQNTLNIEISEAYVNKAVGAILDTLGEPVTQQQQQALEAFHRGDSGTIKRLSVIHLQDNYLKCLGYLVSAPKLTPQTDTILAESIRSAADHVRDKTLAYLGGVVIGNG